MVKVVELPADVDADVVLPGMRWIRGNNAAKSVYLSIKETIVGRKKEVKKEGNHAIPG